MMSAIRYISKICIDYVSRLTYDSLCLAHRGAFSRDDPECGARCGVLRRRLVTAPREVRDTARQALRPGCEEHRCTGCGGNAADGSAAPAVNRHGGAPRGERPTLLDARRLASAWRAASL